MLKGGHGKVRELTLTRAQIARSRSSPAPCSNPAAGSSATCASRPSAKGRTLRCAGRSKRSGRKGAEGLLLDLRGNGGGLLEEAVLNASIFLPEGQVVVTDEIADPGGCRLRRGRRQPAAAADRRPDRPQHGVGGGDPHRRPRRARPGPRWSAPAPTARASSSRRSTLSNGGAMKLTIGEYFTPNGDNLAGNGIHPDVYVRDDPADQTRRGARTRPSRCSPPRRARVEPTRPARRPLATTSGAEERAGRRSMRCSARSSAAAASRSRSRPRPSRAARSAGPRSRRDLTELPTFTVDPATARDFDDAVSARREGDVTRLWIHIADVAAHVAPGSALDREARRRGNSTYAPGHGRADAAARAQRGRLQPRAGGRAACGDGRDRARREAGCP